MQSRHILKMTTKLASLALVLIFSSCSMVKSIGIKSTAGVMKEGIEEINTEANFKLFAQSAGANIKVLETLWFAQKDNLDLLTLLIKGYGGMGFGISETYFLDDLLKGEDDESVHKEQALYHYTKSFNYGLKYLKERGMDSKDLFAKDAASTIKKKLDNNFNHEDMTALFYFAQAWGGMINLRRDSVSMLSSIGSVKSIMDWVCSKDYEFENGSCYLFYAVYEAGRPAMLGGSLEKGKEIFEKFIKKYPHHLLARVAYIQYYIIPTIDEGLYAKEVTSLKREFSHFEGVRNFSVKTNRTDEYIKNSQFNLYNAIAVERLKIIEDNKEEIF